MARRGTTECLVSKRVRAQNRRVKWQDPQCQNKQHQDTQGRGLQRGSLRDLRTDLLRSSGWGRRKERSVRLTLVRPGWERSIERGWRAGSYRWRVRGGDAGHRCAVRGPVGPRWRVSHSGGPEVRVVVRSEAAVAGHLARCDRAMTPSCLSVRCEARARRRPRKSRLCAQGSQGLKAGQARERQNRPVRWRQVRCRPAAFRPGHSLPVRRR